jgi:hypothetical protein
MKNCLRFTVILMAILLAIPTIALCQENFRGIIPLVTTRTEVIKMLGPPNKFGRYELDEGRVYVFYHESACKERVQTCLCNAPLDTVVSVSLEPNLVTKLDDLHLDPALWIERKETGDVPGIATFSNKSSGISYEIIDGEVRTIMYRASEETCRKLANPKPSN